MWKKRRWEEEVDFDEFHQFNNQFHQTIEDMYHRSPYEVTNIESYEMDCLLKSLNSPAHHALYTIHHALQQQKQQQQQQSCCKNNYVKEALLHCHHLVKPGYSFLFAPSTSLKTKQDNDSNDGECQIYAHKGNDDAYNSVSNLETSDIPEEEDHIHICEFFIDDSLLKPRVYFDTIKDPNKNIKKNSLPDSAMPHGWTLLNKKEAVTTKKIIQRISSIASKNNSKGNTIPEEQSVQRTTTTTKLQLLLQELYLHLHISLGTDVRDGTADIALSLSMIPIVTLEESQWMNHIIETLAHIAALEIKRRSTKASRKAVEILMIIEKFAASGCGCFHRQGVCHYMEQLKEAAKLALPKSQNYENVTKETMDGLSSLNLWSERSLLWLWRKGHVFHKVSQRDFKIALALDDILVQYPTLSSLFDDPSLPLVVDVGCGLGVTLLGLASYTGPSDNSKFHLDLDWSNYNYLGADLSQTAIQWASSLALRNGISGRCKFLHTSTENILEYLINTNSNVKLVLLQFPTPYRLQEVLSLNSNEDATHSPGEGNGCNTKLPLGPDDPSFMANPSILQNMVALLHKSNEVDKQDHYLLFQSNCEDVALYIYSNLLQMNLKAIDCIKYRRSFDGMCTSSRTKQWLEMHQNEIDFTRAVGKKWSDIPLIPIRTETEVHSEYQRTPVQRCLFYT